MATNQITVSGEDQRRIGEFALLTQQIEEKNSRLVQLVVSINSASFIIALFINLRIEQGRGC